MRGPDTGRTPPCIVPPCHRGRGQTGLVKGHSLPLWAWPARKILGSGPLQKGPRRMLSGGPNWLILRGSPGRGLEIAIFWVSAWSVVLRAFLEPEKPGARRPEKRPPHASSNAVGWPKMAHREGSPGRGLEIAIFWVSACSRTLRTACLPTRRRTLSGGPPAPLGWAGSENLGQAPLNKGPPHASSHAVGWPKMADPEGVPRTRSRNRVFLGFCVVGGPEGISGAWQKRFGRDARWSAPRVEGILSEPAAT